MLFGGGWGIGEWPDHIEVVHDACRCESRTYVPERTCHVEHIDDDSFHLSCGHEAAGCVWPSFCPCCGAKVVESA